MSSNNFGEMVMYAYILTVGLLLSLARGFLLLSEVLTGTASQTALHSSALVTVLAFVAAITPFIKATLSYYFDRSKVTEVDPQ